MKKILVLCTGNSCRSIIAEAQINAFLDGIEAKSAGVRASGKVNPNAKMILKSKGIWDEKYHSKTLEEVMDEDFDLVVTVCDHAHETCPMFPRPVQRLHVSFEDPDGKEIEAFEATYEAIYKTLLPQISDFMRGK
jgi:arsenate reductase